MSLSRSRNPGPHFLNSIATSFPSILRHVRHDLFQEIVGLLYCSHFLGERTILNEFLKLKKYIWKTNCDSHDPALAIQVWLTYSYKKLYKLKCMLSDQVFRMPQVVKRNLECLYITFNMAHENQKYSVNFRQLNCDEIALLPFSKEVRLEVQNGVTNPTQLFSLYRQKTEEVKAFILFQCMSRLSVAKPLTTTNLSHCSDNSKCKQPLTDVAFPECISSKIKFHTKSKMFTTVSTDKGICDVSSLTACNKPFAVKCYQSFKMDFVTRNCSKSMNLNERTGDLGGKLSSSPFKMQDKSDKDISSKNTSLILCNTSTGSSHFSGTCYVKNVATNLSAKAAEFMHKDLKLRHKLSYNSSDTSISPVVSSSYQSSESDFEMGSIEEVAFGEIISHSAPQTHRFLYTTLSSSSSGSVSESTCEHFDETLNSDESVLFENFNDENSIDDESIVFETNELNSADELSYNYEDSVSEISDSETVSNNFKLYCNSPALDKHNSTINWVKTFYTSEREDFQLDSNGEENFIEFESQDSDTDVESNHSELSFHEMFVRSPSQQHRKYWKVDKTVSPMHKCSESKDNDPVEDVSLELNKASKVTFAPDESLVTVHVFEREPEELLPNTYELDRIRFQMRIHSFDLLLKPFLTVEHRAKIIRVKEHYL